MIPNTSLFQNLLLVLAYLLGSIPTAVWVSRYFFKTDIREHGSGNAGTTNTLRVLGKKPAIFVLAVDLLKGLVAVKLALLFVTAEESKNFWMNLGCVYGMAAVIGHIYPVFAGFRGGKGVATLFGMIIGLNPFIALILALIFFSIVLISKYVSLGSILSSMVLPTLTWLMFPGQEFLKLHIMSAMVPLLVIYTHRENIQRLLKGVESKTHLIGGKK
jgi:glycerol-3-phosphate acyltransferase PlsY